MRVSLTHGVFRTIVKDTTIHFSLIILEKSAELMDVIAAKVIHTLPKYLPSNYCAFQIQFTERQTNGQQSLDNKGPLATFRVQIHKI